MLLLLAFILTPVIEIAVFIEVGGAIGLWPTLAVVIVTAVVGTGLLRQQGLATLRRAQESLARNQFPVQEVYDGMCLLFAGALLLTPGFVTDAVGLLLFLPAFRAMIVRVVGHYLRKSGRIHVATGGARAESRDGRDSSTIEGEYHEVRPAGDDDDDPPRLRR